MGHFRPVRCERRWFSGLLFSYADEAIISISTVPMTAGELMEIAVTTVHAFIINQNEPLNVCLNARVCEINERKCGRKYLRGIRGSACARFYSANSQYAVAHRNSTWKFIRIIEFRNNF